MNHTTYKLGQLIKQRREKFNGLEDLPIRGVSRDGFIPPKQKDADTSLYNVFYLKDFVFNPARMEVNSIALNTEFDKAICSSLYEVFFVKDESILLPEYLNLFVKRDEFARLCDFMGCGSAREYCRFANIADISITLPPLSVQKKYVDIYKSMVDNQKEYEKGIDDLKLVCDGYLDKLKKECVNGKLLGDIIKESDKRNYDKKYKIVSGVNKDKMFMPSVAVGEDLSNYKVVMKNQFACNLMHVGRDVIVPISLNQNDYPIIVSPAYIVFYLCDEEIIPEYLLMWFSRTETDRNAWFMSDTSVRSGMEKKQFFEMRIPIPDIKIQNSIADIYKVYIERKKIGEQLKKQIKDLCPILIKGSIEEAEK